MARRSRTIPAPGSALILACEDNAEDTIRRRLDLAGADVSNVYIVDSVRTNRSERGFPLDRDVELLRAHLDQTGDVRLLIIDPISAYCGKTDTHRNSEVRAMLQPLTDMAAENRLVIVGINHLSKGTGKAVYRSIGSIGFAAAAVRHRLITANPFDEVKAGTRSNSDRQRFIELDATEKIIEAAPDAEWRLTISLARFGGLRVPSEVLSLRWSDIDRERKRILVHAPKTEHHEGKATRWMPLFPELVVPLQDALDQADEGAEFVIMRHRPASLRSDNGSWRGVNLRTQFARIIKRVGLKLWPRLWQNLRSSRETELTHQFPLHVVTAWLGNSEAVATRHYLQVTEADFERAASEPSAEPVRKPVRHGHEPDCMASQTRDAASRFSAADKEKRPHAKTYDRPDWRIGDSNP